VPIRILVHILAHISRFFLVIYCRGSGTKTEAGVSLGPESVRLRSRHGDSHF
jgi:hypothetical protein